VGLDDPYRDLSKSKRVLYTLLYWVIFSFFFIFMLVFVWPTIACSLTIMAVLLVGFLILTPTDHRMAVLTFIAGSGLGYFLEYWGTTRGCWVYYTLAKPPLFAVLAHGMAAVAFWRTALVLGVFYPKILQFRLARRLSPPKSSPPQQKPEN
jgi:hypothetical protein